MNLEHMLSENIAQLKEKYDSLSTKYVLQKGGKEFFLVKLHKYIAVYIFKRIHLATYKQGIVVHLKKLSFLLE